MLLHIVRTMRRKGTLNGQFMKRIPVDVAEAAVGVKLELPVGDRVVRKTTSPIAKDISLSLQISDTA